MQIGTGEAKKKDIIIQALCNALEFYKEGKFSPNIDNCRIANHALAMAGVRVHPACVRRFSFDKDAIPVKSELGDTFSIEDEADGEKIDLYVVFSQNGVVIAEEVEKQEPQKKTDDIFDLRDSSNFNVGSF